MDTASILDVPNLCFADWGLIEYQKAEAKQLEWLQEIALKKRPQTIIFCTHPAIVTLGRGSQNSDYQQWKGAIAHSSRGGRATYHGPSQLIIYPLIDLNQKRSHIPPRDIRSFIEALSLALANTLRYFDPNLKAITSLYGTNTKGQPSKTGLWINERKIASLGIAVKKWITYHGAAINWKNDPNAFADLNPCGFSPNIMTSVEKETGRCNQIDQFKISLKKELQQIF